VPGRFHELSVRTDDIRASVEFYESLGFSHCRTGDTWPHPYGVLTDGRIFIGLHQYRFPSPSLTWVRAGVAAAIPEYRGLGIELAFAKTGDDCFNEIGFRDPSGQMNAVLEARTYFPPDRRPGSPSACGWFEAFSIPTPDPAASKAFWERFGFVALDEVDAPWPHLPLTRDDISLALHRPRVLDAPALVFEAEDMRERIARLAGSGLRITDELPRGLAPGANAMLRAPEGTLLLLLAAA
jgi:catechol 2,3-dioxygenase-like lactoylglutathione lyase family enzyme